MRPPSQGRLLAGSRLARLTVPGGPGVFDDKGMALPTSPLAPRARIRRGQPRGSAHMDSGGPHRGPMVAEIFGGWLPFQACWRRVAHGHHVAGSPCGSATSGAGWSARRAFRVRPVEDRVLGLLHALGGDRGSRWRWNRAEPGQSHRHRLRTALRRRRRRPAGNVVSASSWPASTWARSDDDTTTAHDTTRARSRHEHGHTTITSRHGHGDLNLARPTCSAGRAFTSVLAIVALAAG